VAITYLQYQKMVSFNAIGKSNGQSLHGEISPFITDPSVCRISDDDFGGDDDDPFHWRKTFDSSMLPVLLVGAMLTLSLGGALAALHYWIYIRRRRAILAAAGGLDFSLAWGEEASHEAVNELPSKVYQPLEDKGDAHGDSITITISDTDTDTDNGIDIGVGAGAGATASGTEQSHSTHEERHCSICLDDFQAGQLQRVLPCGHVFHAPCVDEWLVAGLTRSGEGVCPLCKQNPLPSHNGLLRNTGAENQNQSQRLLHQAALPWTQVVRMARDMADALSMRRQRRPSNGLAAGLIDSQVDTELEAPIDGAVALGDGDSSSLHVTVAAPASDANSNSTEEDTGFEVEAGTALASIKPDQEQI